MKTDFSIQIIFFSERPDVVDTLAQTGVNLDEKCTLTETALLIALDISSEAMVATLIKNGVNVNLTDDFGDSPLHRAALYCT